MAEELTTEQLLTYLIQHSVNNKVSIDNLSNLLFDARFPDRMFEGAKSRLQEIVTDWTRQKHLAGILLPKSQQLEEIEKRIDILSKNRVDNLSEINQLKQQRRLIKDEMRPLDKEFTALAFKLKEIKGYC